MKETTKRKLDYALFALVIYLLGFWGGHSLWPERAVVQEPVAEVLVVDDELTDWQIFQIALAKTESEFNPKARGTSNDCGVLQITPILVKEVNRLSKDTVYVHNDSFDPQKSFEMFSIIQTHHNPDSSIDRAIKIWNPGGAAIGYSTRVYNNIEFVKNYEKIRAIVK